MRIFLVLAALFLVVAGCVQRAPTLPLFSGKALDKSKATEDWERWNAEENKRQAEAQINGERLTGEQIDRIFRGRILRGCFPNGERFVETLHEDGRFTDEMNRGAVLGLWRVDDSKMCFRYPERANAGQPDSCFAVFNMGGHFDFYTPDFSMIAASTSCSR